MSNCRKGSDFSCRDFEALTLLQRFARPILQRKRAEHQLRLLDAAELTAELLYEAPLQGRRDRFLLPRLVRPTE